MSQVNSLEVSALVLGNNYVDAIQKYTDNSNMPRYGELCFISKYGADLTSLRGLGCEHLESYHTHLILFSLINDYFKMEEIKYGKESVSLMRANPAFDFNEWVWELRDAIEEWRTVVPELRIIIVMPSIVDPYVFNLNNLQSKSYNLQEFFNKDVRFSQYQASKEAKELYLLGKTLNDENISFHWEQKEVFPFHFAVRRSLPHKSCQLMDSFLLGETEEMGSIQSYSDGLHPTERCVDKFWLSIQSFILEPAGSRSVNRSGQDVSSKEETVIQSTSPSPPPLENNFY